MHQNQRIGRDDSFLRQYNYGDTVVIAADLPVDDRQVDVDVIDGTAIVVIEQNGRISETELDVPRGETTVDVTNGVLTISVDPEAATGSANVSAERDDQTTGQDVEGETENDETSPQDEEHSDGANE